MVGLVVPRRNATQVERSYEYDAAISRAAQNLSSSLLLPATNAQNLSWFNDSALDLYVRERNVRWPCTTASGEPFQCPVHDVAKA